MWVSYHMAAAQPLSRGGSKVNNWVLIYQDMWTVLGESPRRWLLDTPYSKVSGHSCRCIVVKAFAKSHPQGWLFSVLRGWCAIKSSDCRGLLTELGRGC